jgi:hypothetical protein
MCVNGAPDVNMELIWDRILRIYYRANPNGSRFTNITLSMFCSVDHPRATFPRLKGKAAEVKALMPALVWAFGMVMQTGNDQHDQILSALKCSEHLDAVMDDHKTDNTLPADVAETFKQAGFAMNVFMNALCQHYGHMGINAMYLFNIVPKNHFLCHICLQAQYLNQRLAWCYMGEDMMHHMRRLGAGCARGNDPVRASQKLMYWYRQGLSLVIVDRKRLLRL